MRTATLILLATIAAGGGSIVAVKRFNLLTGLTAVADPVPLPAVPFEPNSLPADAAVVAAGEVDVENGTTPLSPLATGVVKSAPAREGARVAAGEALVELDARAAELQVEGAEAALAEAKLRLEQARQTAAEFPHQLEQQAQAVVAALARRTAQQNQVQRLDGLRKQGAVTEENYQSAKERAAEAEADHRVQVERQNQLRLVDPQRAVRLAETAVRAAQAQAELARQRLDQHTLKAPAAGFILRVFVNPGQILTADAKHPAIWFRPDRPLVVRCEVEQEYVDRVVPGAKADIANDGGGNARWTGVVQSRAEWVAPKRTLLNENAELREAPTVECIVRIDPNQAGLRVGQRVRVLFHAPATSTISTPSRDMP